MKVRHHFALGIGSAMGGLYLFAITANILWLIAGTALSALAAWAYLDTAQDPR